MTNSLEHRIIEHYLQRGKNKTFAGRYYCHLLIYYELFQYVEDAIAREKEIKKWSRTKKEDLIQGFNPEWSELNLQLLGQWPPNPRDMFPRKR
jgi:putative endonuclease